MNLWNDCEKKPITELLEFIVDNRGKTVPTTETGHILIATNCIKNDSLYPKYEKIRFLSQETYETFFRSHPLPGDIIFVNKGTPGRVCLVPEPVNFCIAQDMIALRANKKKVDNHYLFAVLRSPMIQAQIHNTYVGDVIPHFKKQFMDRLLIPIPSMAIQKKIGDIYYTLCDKIEVNLRINEQLEELAQALFKSWFVDFEPFRDGEFVESELGMIPEGWKVGTLGELCDSISKKHSFKKDKLIFLNTGDIHNNIYLHNNYMLVKDMPGQAKKTIEKGDILYSEIRPVNRHFALVNFDSTDYVVSTKLMVIRSRNINNLRLFQYLTSKDVVDFLQQEAETRSGTFPQIRFENIQRLKMIIASNDVETQYASLLSFIYSRMENNNKEITHLTNLRDTLLPKLMSGEIDVNEVEI